jgi:hypothetical protein
MNPGAPTDQYLMQQPMWVPNDIAASRIVQSSVDKSMTLIRATVSQPLPDLQAPVDKSPENLGHFVSALQAQKHLENRELMRDRLLLLRGMVQSVHAQNKVAEAALKAELAINKELHKANTESDKKLREYQAKLKKGVSPADIEAMRQAMLAGGFAAVAKLIKDDWVRPFVIMGSVAECAAELSELMARLGLDEFQLPILDMGSAPELMAQVARVLAAT